ncbi:MAG: hypothetical protein IJ981_03120 [Clostridia bacterium]|nr:hypothetical protein [Clostridia bacterium]
MSIQGEIDRITSEVQVQSSLMSQIKTALQGKASGGGSGGAMYRHTVKAVARDANHDGYYEVTYIFYSSDATQITSSTFNPPAGATASHKAVLNYGGYIPNEEYGIGAFNQTSEWGTPFYHGYATVQSGLVERSIGFEWEGYDSFVDNVAEV